MRRGHENRGPDNRTTTTSRTTTARSPFETRDREQTMAGETLGVIGTGRMGGPMAGRLLDAGYSLVIYDTQNEAMQPLLRRGAQQAKSPADVASRAEIVLASLPTPDIVKAVAL